MNHPASTRHGHSRDHDHDHDPEAEPLGPPLSEGSPQAPQVLGALGREAGAEREPGVRPFGLHTARLARRVGWLAVGMVLFGFVGGYGVGYGVRKREAKTIEAAKTPKPAALAPIVKGMHFSPNGTALAFTAVYDQSRRSSRFVLDVSSKRFSGAESPEGWQDFVLGWDRSGSSLLLRRERIPRPVADAKTGFYTQKMLTGRWPRFEPGVSALKPSLPPGEKSALGFWDSSDRLVVRTSRAPKSIFLNGARLDASPDLYLQSQVVREAGRDALYVVRNSGPGVGSLPALFRVQDGKPRRLSPDLPNLQWAYVAENARWMIAARYAENDADWIWDLYQVTPSKAVRVSQEVIPGDVIRTYWSPDFKSVLGASGESLWRVEIPSLRCIRIGNEKSANADDAAWSPDSKSVLVAVDGKILKLDVASNQTSEVWHFPDQYWN